MNVNCVNIEGRSLNITNMNFSIRFNKTREIFFQCYPSFKYFKYTPNNISYQCKCREGEFKGRVT